MLLFLGFLWQHLRSIYSQLLSVTLLTDREPARSHYTCSLHVFHHPSPCIISGEDKSFLEEQTRSIRTVKRCGRPLCINICSKKRLIWIKSDYNTWSIIITYNNRFATCCKINVFQVFSTSTVSFWEVYWQTSNKFSGFIILNITYNDLFPFSIINNCKFKNLHLWMLVK